MMPSIPPGRRTARVAPRHQQIDDDLLEERGRALAKLDQQVTGEALAVPEVSRFELLLRSLRRSLWRSSPRTRLPGAGAAQTGELPELWELPQEGRVNREVLAQRFSS